MAYSLPGTIKIAIGTTRKPKFEVYDQGGATSFQISSGSFSLRNTANDDLADSGSLTVNNADVGTAGNTIKTIQCTLDLTNTDIVVGNYQLAMRVVLSNGESDMFLATIELVDFRSAI
jgi:hypothetical protein